MIDLVVLAIILVGAVQFEVSSVVAASHRPRAPGVD
jgi:hypothetical protein